MKIINKQIEIPKSELYSFDSLQSYLNSDNQKLNVLGKPIRFIVSESRPDTFVCEIDFINFETEQDKTYFNKTKSIFDHKKRVYEKTDEFTGVLIIPTGIGAEIGGYCGDGNVAARVLASACDTLITHPNVVNASDLNEMTENTLYVEGGMLTDFLNGTIGLQKTRSNRILMLMDKSDEVFFNDEIVNAVSSARVTIGVDCDVIEMPKMIESNLNFTDSGRAAAEINHFERLLKDINDYGDEYDALGLATIVQIPEERSKEYFETDDEGVNPWGGAEAIITHSVGAAFMKPTAHSPLSLSMGDNHIEYNLGIIDPRKAPESASVAYLHCILKGLHRAPRIVEPDKGLNVENVSCLVTADGCIGLPVLACLLHDIPVIAVKNKNVMKNNLSELPFKPGKLLYAENYFEAAGLMSALKSGVSPESLQRPINPTKVLERKA